MKVDPNKSNVVLLETELDVKLSVKEEPTKATEKKLTTWDIIGLVVLTMFQRELFQDTLTALDNQKENKL